MLQCVVPATIRSFLAMVASEHPPRSMVNIRSEFRSVSIGNLPDRKSIHTSVMQKAGLGNSNCRGAARSN